ncbi:MAG: hypothetical protein CL913_02500 [Deltaproteobacteria bacterium]|nr:hypothetical protein [Deltaproteobacteria bacterium]
MNLLVFQGRQSFQLFEQDVGLLRSTHEVATNDLPVDDNTLQLFSVPISTSDADALFQETATRP